MPWKKLDLSTQIRWEREGEEIIGTIQSVQGTNYGVKRYEIMTDDGAVATMLGTTVLDRVLPGLMGQRIRILYKGESPTRGGYRVKLFDVWVWETEEGPEKRELSEESEESGERTATTDNERTSAGSRGDEPIPF